MDAYNFYFNNDLRSLIFHLFTIFNILYVLYMTAWSRTRTENFDSNIWTLNLQSMKWIKYYHKTIEHNRQSMAPKLLKFFIIAVSWVGQYTIITTHFQTQVTTHTHASLTERNILRLKENNNHFNRRKYKFARYG